MQNYKLLEIHRKKLSLNFAIFILLSIWLLAGLFLGTKYYNNKNFIHNRLEQKYSQVVSILEKKLEYTNQILSWQKAVSALLERSLNGVTIFENGIIVLGDISDEFEDWNSWYYSTKTTLYYQNITEVDNKTYTIIIAWENAYSIFIFLEDYMYFIFFSSIFGVVFYILAYVFVGKNIAPIRKTITSLEMFNWQINHELKTPLAELLSTLALAEKTKTNYEHSIKQSLESWKKIQKILDSILGIMQLVDGWFKKEKIILANEVEQIVRQVGKKALEKNIKLNLDIRTPKYSSQINTEHLEISLMNILENAIKYSHKENQIDILVKSWTITVRDNGVGIKKENLENIFEWYFRENYNDTPGQWLGLALVKSIVDMNHWKIDIESQKDRWTSVYLEIK